MDSPAFKLSSVNVVLGGRPVLRDVDLEVGRGEIVAVVGPSGAGKTTLLRLLNGTVRPAAGTVEVQGVDLAQLSAPALRRARTSVGFCHQAPSLLPNLRVFRNVIAGGLGRGGLWTAVRSMLLPRREELERAHAILELVGVEDKLFQRTDTLSGGQLQRVALARALFQEPAALVLDEPVAAVDPTRSRALVELMLQVAADRHLSLIASLHDLALAREFFPRLVGVRGGRVCFDLPAGEVREADIESLYRIEVHDDG